MEQKVHNISNDDLVKSYLYFRKEYNAQELIENNPQGKPNFPLKQIIYNTSNGITSESSKGKEHDYNITVSRWKALLLNGNIPNLSSQKSTKFILQEDVYDYICAFQNAVEWHVNFAGNSLISLSTASDSNLFFAFSGPLFAQDEIQAAEIPILGHIKQELAKSSNHEFDHPMIPLTRYNKQATPILIRNAERRCEVSLAPDANAGRPRGLYGNVFATVRPEALFSAIKVLDPPQKVNIIAMAALEGGRRCYTMQQVMDTYQTAYTSFRAAVVESEGKSVVVHTGNWGTGAFGGNREFMASVQLVAAQHAGVDVLVYHSFNRVGTDGYNAGLKTTKELLEKDIDVFDVLTKWVNKKYLWGYSDGN